MRLFTRSTTAFQIACGLLVLAVCVLAKPKLKPKTTDESSDDDYQVEDLPVVKNHRSRFQDEINLHDAFETEEDKEQLPVLPPIILLEFGNTSDITSNSTNQGDEKSKRTIDSNLGYGYNNNDLFSGKHQYYLPNGKGGTAVTIEESIAFEPKTVTEYVKPITEKDETVDEFKDGQTTKNPLFEALPDPLPLENERQPLPVYPPYPVFGQRTKLHKTAGSDLGHSQGRIPTKLYSNSYTTPATPLVDSYNRPIYSSHNHRKPSEHQNGYHSYYNSPNTKSYSRPIGSSYLPSYTTGTSHSSQTSSSDLKTSSSSNGGFEPVYNLANYPRYTVENGIKYEHKIVWKYPDGKISETPPMSYVNSYSEYANDQKTHKGSTSGFRPSIPYTPPSSHQQHNAQATSYNPSSASAQSNIYSPRPVQFPNDQEQLSGSQQEQGQFISATSGNQYETGHRLNPATYSGQYGLKQNPKISNYRPSISDNNQYNSYSNYRPATKYSVNSPNADYTHQNANGHNLFSPNGQLNKQVLSQYSPQAQQYLTKVLESGKVSPKQEYHNPTSESYPSTDYSSLLNYSPSISQYVKNPSSILKAQPTFIQAGNSLIPVIILRVDGAPPIQPKAASNINLKSLLRQYLTQYANSVSKANQNTDYEFGSTSNEDATVSHSQANPVEDLTQFTQRLASLRQSNYQDPEYTSGSYSENYAEQQTQATQRKSSTYDHHGYRSSHTGLVNSSKNHTVPLQKKQQKVKSVQIIEDPRYTSYKTTN